MSWQYTPYLIPLLVSATLSATLGLVAYRHRHVRAAGAFAALMAGSAWWSLFYGLYLASTELGSRLLLGRTLTLGAIAVAVAWLVFAARYGGYDRWLTRGGFAALLAVPALTVALLFTDEYHGLFWSRFELVERAGLVSAAWSGGPGFWLHVAYSWMLMSLAVVLLLGALLRSPPLYRHQMAAVLLGAVVPWLGNIAHLTGWLRLPANPMPFLFTISGILFGWAMFRFRFLGIVPIARATVVEEMEDAVLVVDARGCLVDLNPAAARIVGQSAPATMGVALPRVLPPLAPLVGAEPEERALVTLPAPPAGAPRSYDVRVTPLVDRGRRGAGSVLVLRDVTDRVALEQQLRYSAFYDALTGLPNRVLLLDRLAQAVERTRRGQHPFALLFLDLDRFKRINDSLGHAAGDALLAAFAQRLAACMRPADTVARMSGDEFAVLVEEVDDISLVTRVAERIQRAAAEPVLVDEQPLVAAVSIGIALSATPGAESAEAVLRNADMAMYRAKRAGSIGYAIFDETMHADAMARLQLEAELRGALERGEFTLHYQPIVEVAGGALFGLEALLRWNHPRRGLLTPSDFMQAAAEMGMMRALSEWTLGEVAAQAERWRGMLPGTAPPMLAVNVAAQPLVQDPEFVRAIELCQARLRRSGATLLLDVGETDLMERRGQLGGTMARLVDCGVRFAVDDFGTGASSLPALRRLPIAGLKIDRRFVAALTSDSSAREIAGLIVSLARSLRVQVFAEGVETAEQLSLLRELGCDLVQGYLLGRPVIADQLVVPVAVAAQS